MGKKLPEAIVKVAVDIAINPSMIIKILKDFRVLVEDAVELDLPMCKDVFEEEHSENLVDVAVEEEQEEEPMLGDTVRLC